ncbi:MAG: CPBP family intramembrane metalloprotease [Lachnospiraceae bacterium]|nr:CPBP family intramembrane metalloprotease [Lachnospiraceae bacterium]
MDKKKIIKFVAITYLIAYAIQIPVSIFAVKNQNTLGNTVFRGGLCVVMFSPFLAALITKGTLKGMGWKPKFKGNIKWIFWAYLVVAISVFGGMALFYAIFPEFFDTTGSYLIKSGEALGIDVMGELNAKGISYETYMIVQTVLMFTVATFVNTFVAIGEETGWRGFLYPELKKGLSFVKTWIVGGTIWAGFHFPCILIAGYEYGKDYIGAPVLGILTFTLSGIFLGALHEIIYSKTECIWYPAFLHGMVNAVAAFPLMFLNMNAENEAGKYMIFGPAMNGLIGMIPMALIVVVMAVLGSRKRG